MSNIFFTNLIHLKPKSFVIQQVLSMDHSEEYNSQDYTCLLTKQMNYLYISKSRDSLVGKGTFGEVKKCFYRTERGVMQVAAKIMTEDLFDETRKAFNDEKESLRTAAAENPGKRINSGVVPLLDTYEEGFLIFVMPLYDWNLKEFVEMVRSKQDYSESVRIEIYFILFAQIYQGLLKLHQFMTHWDIKPANILVKKIGPNKTDILVSFGDLGLSRKLKSDPKRKGTVSQTAKREGTPDYMAPELLKYFIDNFGEIEQTKLKRINPKKIDIWSFGIVAYEIFFENNFIAGKIPSLNLPQDINQSEKDKLKKNYDGIISESLYQMRNIIMGEQMMLKYYQFSSSLECKPEFLHSFLKYFLNSCLVVQYLERPGIEDYQTKQKTIREGVCFIFSKFFKEDYLIDQWKNAQQPSEKASQRYSKILFEKEDQKQQPEMLQIVHFRNQNLSNKQITDSIIRYLCLK